MTTAYIDWSEALTTTAAPAQDVAVIEGSFTLTVANAASFASDPTVEAALKTAVAAGFDGIDASDVFITGVEAVRRLSASVRGLQDGGVRVSYSVEVPPDFDASSVASALGDVELEAMTSAINEALDDAGFDAAALGVQVVAVEPPAVITLAPSDADEEADPSMDNQGTDWSSWDQDGRAEDAGGWPSWTLILLLAALYA